MTRKGRLSFTCADGALNAGFLWAKEQALFYSHESDQVGDWYEAALPNRKAFCMRDVSHQCMGGQFLGLFSHNKNMLLRFAQGIAESRDFCSFWEIDNDYKPAPVDYRSDADFWYNLPANFDVMDAIWRVYEYSGDKDFVHSHDFTNFRDLTVNQYVKRWDINGDGILERDTVNLRRGIPSYDEEDGMDKAAVMSDMLAIQIRGYHSAAALYEAGQQRSEAVECQTRAAAIHKILSSDWWDEKENRFYGYRNLDGTLVHCCGHSVALSYYQVLEEENQRLAHLDMLHSVGQHNPLIVEQISHYGELFFFHNQGKRGLYWLRRMIDPSLHRREYPELSYAVINCYMTGLAGVKWNGITRTLTLSPPLLQETGQITVKNMPIADGELDFTIEENRMTVTNRGAEDIFFRNKRVSPSEAVVWDEIRK